MQCVYELVLEVWRIFTKNPTYWPSLKCELRLLIPGSQTCADSQQNIWIERETNRATYWKLWQIIWTPYVSIWFTITDTVLIQPLLFFPYSQLEEIFEGSSFWAHFWHQICCRKLILGLLRGILLKWTRRVVNTSWQVHQF